MAKQQKHFFYDKDDGVVAFYTMDDILANGAPNNGLQYIGPVIHEGKQTLAINGDTLYVINTFSGKVWTVILK